MNPLLAITTASLDERLEPALDAARKVVRGVVIDARSELRPASFGETGRRHFLKKLDERGLRLQALACPTRRPLYDPSDFDQRIDSLRGAMLFANQLRSRLLLVRTGRIPMDGTPDWEVLTGVLNDLARYGNHIGVSLALHPGRESPETLGRLCDLATSGLVGIDVDPAAFVLAGHDPVAAVQMLHERLLHVRLRDAVREGEEGGLEVPVGRGEVEWLELLATLDEAGYRRCLTAERTAGNDRPGDAIRAVSYVNSLLPS